MAFISTLAFLYTTLHIPAHYITASAGSPAFKIQPTVLLVASFAL